MNRFTIPVVVLLCFAILCLSGCWDNRDIANLNHVAAVGIDKTEEGRFELTVQIIKTSVISAREQGSTEDATFTISRKGDTVFEAIRNLLSVVGKRPLYSHTQLLVLGESVAEDGLAEVLDFFERDHETRRRAYVLIAKDLTAGDVLRAKCSLESIPAEHIVETIETVTGLPEKVKLELVELIQLISSKGQNPLVGVIYPINQKKDDLYVHDLDITGGAGFRGDRFAGWLDARQTRGYLYVVNKVESGLLVVEDPLNPEKKVSIEIKNSKSDLSIEFREDVPVLKVATKITGNIAEVQGTGDLTEPQKALELENAFAQRVHQEISQAIEAAQKDLGSDIFGFGEVMHRKHLEYWKTVKDNWDSAFAEMPVEVKVDAAIEKPGLINEAVQPK